MSKKRNHGGTFFTGKSVGMVCQFLTRLEPFLIIEEFVYGPANFVTYFPKSSRRCGIVINIRGRVVESPMVFFSSVGENGASFSGGIADGDNMIERLVDIFFNTIRTV